MHTTKVQQQAAIATQASTQSTEEVAPDTMTEIIGKYGLVPFIGLVGATALSKEVMLLDAEFLGMLEFTAFVAIFYTAFGDKITQTMAANAKAGEDAMDNKWAFDVAWLENYKKQMQWQIDVLELREQQATDYASAMEDFAVAQNFEVQHKARAAVHAKLTAILSSEAAAAAAENDIATAQLIERVHARFGVEGDSKLIKESLDLAISMIGAPRTTSTKDDPVKRVFLEEMERK